MDESTPRDESPPGNRHAQHTDRQAARRNDALRRIAANPLDLSPHFPRIAERWEAWWHRENRRPLLLGGVRRDASLRWDKAFDLLENTEAWLSVRRSQCEHTYWMDATPPSIRVDIGPVTIGAYLGAPLIVDEQTQTSWQSPIIEDWQDVEELTLTPHTEWYERVRELLRATARDAAGRYLVCLPDLAGAIDVLTRLRGTEQLMLDLFEYPEQVKACAERLVSVWESVFFEFYDLVLDQGSAPVQWLHAWSSTPYTLPTCDFNALIGPKQFDEFCLPSLRRQASIAGRCLFHLDGPDAARHAPSLARTEEITAVQFTPGTGTPSALAQMEMFRMLQNAGKPVVVVCPYEEATQVARELDHAGLAIIPESIPSVKAAEELEREVAGHARE